MNVGVREPILLILAAFFFASFVLPIYAAIKAFGDAESGWGIGILIGIFVPFGFVIAIVYLLRRRDFVA